MYTVNGCLFVVITCVSFQVWQAATEDERSRYKQFSDTLASLEELWYTLWGFYTPPIFRWAGISKRTLMSDIHCGVFIPPQSLIYPFSLFSPSDQGLKRNMLLEFWFWNVCALKISASAKPWWQQPLRARKEIFWNFGTEIFVPQYLKISASAKPWWQQSHREEEDSDWTWVEDKKEEVIISYIRIEHNFIFQRGFIFYILYLNWTWFYFWTFYTFYTW